jgi:hypothetical protein
MNKEKNWHRSAECGAIAALQRRLAGGFLRSTISEHSNARLPRLAFGHRR